MVENLKLGERTAPMGHECSRRSRSEDRCTNDTSILDYEVQPVGSPVRSPRHLLCHWQIEHPRCEALFASESLRISPAEADELRQIVMTVELA
jgi:hypothetical protein